MATPREQLEQLRKIKAGELSPRDQLNALRALKEQPVEQGLSIREQLKKLPIESPAVTSAAISATRGFAEFAGFPVDAVNSALSVVGLDTERPVGGSQQFLGFLDELGFTEQAPGLGTTVAREVGFGAAGFGVLGVAARARQGLSFGKYINPIIDFVAERPAAALLVDLGLSIPAGAGAEAGKRIAPEVGLQPQTGEAIGRLIGGIGTAVVAIPTVGGAIATARGARSLAKGLTQKGREAHVAKVLRQEMSKPETEAKLLSAEDVEFGRPTTAELIDDPGLISLQRATASKGRGLAQEIELLQNRSLREGLEPLAGKEAARPAAARLFDKAVEDTVKRIEIRIAKALEASQRAINNLGIEAPIDRVQAIARENLDTALKTARADETKLWNKATGGKVDATSVIERARKIIREIPKTENPQETHPVIYQIAKVTDVEKVPTGLLDEFGVALTREQIVGAKSLIDETETIKNIDALRSRLLSVVRKENASGNFNRSRKVKDLLDSIFTELKPTTKKAAVTLVNVNKAREFSKSFNDTFTRGPVGKILGYEQSGDLRIAPELTLEKLLRPGTEGLLGFRAFIKATGKDGDSVARQFITAKFANETLDNAGVFNPGKAVDFVRRHRFLDEIPDLKVDMLNTASGERLARSIEKSYRNRIDRIQKTSAAARWTSGEPIIQADAVLKSKTPLKDAKSLMSRAAKDPSGEATQGVKAGFYEAMMNRIAPDRRQALDLGGEPFINAKGLRIFVKDHSDVIKTVWGESGLRILRSVSRGATLTANKLRPGVTGSDTAEKATVLLRGAIGSIGVLLGSKLSLGVHVLLAAGIGRRVTTGLFDTMVNAGTRGIHSILENALYDPKFAQALLRANAKPINGVHQFPRDVELSLLRFSVIQELLRTGAQTIPPEQQAI